MVGWTIISNETGTVENHTDREVLDGNIVDNLVISTLQER
jgi:hypothetical protein